MDPRRFLILACAGLTLSGCALPGHPAPAARFAPTPDAGLSCTATQPVDATNGAKIGDLSGLGTLSSGALGPENQARLDPLAHSSPPAGAPSSLSSTKVDPLSVRETTTAQTNASTRGLVPYETARTGQPGGSRAPQAATQTATLSTPLSGRRAIVAANADARAASRSDAFVGGVQVFAWSPGRVFEVWTAPLRVTTLTLGAGETLVSKAAGDTLRWQIGETTSGSGASQRTHVLLKPLERGLETNLVLTTNHRVYLLDLKSGAADGFNAAVAWDAPTDSAFVEVTAGALSGANRTDVQVSDPVVTPQGPLDARYRIEPQGRRARWTPTAVFNDGARTFITFAADLQVDEAPALFVVAADGETQLVNYRQAGGLFIVDRVFDRAELRLGDRRPQVVRIRRLQGDHR